MNKKLFFALVSVLLMASCNDGSIYKGFEKTESGAYMKFYEKSNSGLMPSIGDGVTIEMAQYFNDSLLMTTAGDRPIEMRVEESSFVGDVPDAIRMMRVGDSARVVVLADSVFITMMQIDPPEEFAGKPIYYDLKLLSIKPLEEIEAERQSLLDSLKNAELTYLDAISKMEGIFVSESGLVVFDKKGYGPYAQLGDYVNFDLVLALNGGDTLINTFGDEPIEMQYGEDFSGPGVDEALGMVSKGNTMHFAVPSGLAFDSTGFEGMIPPYSPLNITIRMNSIMDKEAYEKKQAALEAQREAERERMQAIEKERIAEFVASHDITVTPTESGLYIIPQEAGEGDLAIVNDVVLIHYVLQNLNGDTIESSYQYDQPLAFTLGKGEMIPAIEEALMTMAPGAKVTLICPSELAFGEVEIDSEKLPAYSPLVVELELVEIK